MIDKHDHREIRCRRLGHPVPFSYCRKQGTDSPCSLIFDCWWEQFDVAEFLKSHLPADKYAALTQRKTEPKAVSIVALIEQAKKQQREEES